MYPDTESGLGIAGALADLLDGEGGGGLPSAEPPMPLTHLWLIAPTVPTRAFRWVRSSGLVSSPFPTRAATGGLSRRRAGAVSREAGAGVGRRRRKQARAASRHGMYVPEVLATQARSCAAMAAG